MNHIPTLLQVITPYLLSKRFVRISKLTWPTSTDWNSAGTFASAAAAETFASAARSGPWTRRTMVRAAGQCSLAAAADLDVAWAAAVVADAAEAESVAAVAVVVVVVVEQSVAVVAVEVAGQTWTEFDPRCSSQLLWICFNFYFCLLFRFIWS